LTIVTTAATVAATATAATVSTVAAATATAASASAFRAWARFVDDDFALSHFSLVHLVDRCLSFFFGAHFDETKAPGSAGIKVGNKLRASHLAVGGKQLMKLVFR
jgi:hypothetical protein